VLSRRSGAGEREGGRREREREKKIERGEIN